jgi:chromosome segregation ATPase
MVRNEQTKALIEEVQRLQDVEKDRDKFRDLAQQRAEIGQSIMDAVADDIVMAERTRDEHWHQIRKLNKDLSTKGKTLANQNNQMSKLRSDLTEAKRVAENAEVTIQMLRSSSFTSSRASSKKR